MYRNLLSRSRRGISFSFADVSASMIELNVRNFEPAVNIARARWEGKTISTEPTYPCSKRALVTTLEYNLTTYRCNLFNSIDTLLEIKKQPLEKSVFARLSKHRSRVPFMQESLLRSGNMLDNVLLQLNNANFFFFA